MEATSIGEEFGRPGGDSSSDLLDQRHAIGVRELCRNKRDPKKFDGKITHGDAQQGADTILCRVSNIR